MGASYADEFNVEITQTSGGAEYRRLVHPYPVRHFTIHYTLNTADLWSRIIALYHRANGWSNAVGAAVLALVEKSSLTLTRKPASMP